MDTGQIRLSDLLMSLSGYQDVVFRMALGRVGASWRVRSLVVEVFPTYAELPQSPLNYGEVTFVLGHESGASVASWLRDALGAAQGYTFEVPDFQDAVFWQMMPSHHRSLDLPPLPWPYTRYTLYSPTSPQPPPSLNRLVGTNLPSFRHYTAAVAELIYNLADVSPMFQVPNESACITIAQTSAWLEHIHIGPTSIAVTVAGHAVQGCRLELTRPPDSRAALTLNDAGEYRFTVRSGSPTEVELLLSHDAALLDELIWRSQQPALAPIPEHVGTELAEKERAAGAAVAGESASAPGGGTETMAARRVFISYRRDDTKDDADRFYDWLSARLGKENVFLDIDTIPLGEEFPTFLDKKLQQADVVLALIGPAWIRILNERAGHGVDYVAVELETALHREGVRVIPILVDGATMPSAEQLPERLVPLSDRNALRFYREYFDAGVERILQTIGGT